MICSVMQPYLFPYIGYYQLVQSADVFIFYDDVTFIKQSYINRNSILVNGKQQRFTLPVPKLSSNILIQDLLYGQDRKVLKSIKQSYSKAPFFKDVYPIIECVFNQQNRSINHVNRLSIESVFKYLGVEKQLFNASELDYNRELDRADRLIELCKHFGCKEYINSPGGRELYEPQYFTEHGIKLGFIENMQTQYQQLKSDEFVPYLSIIDVLMNCSKDQVIEMLNNYEVSPI
ncbi:WbqC family protein [Thiomicrorhabdus chilensis]|uniref:WbqC family protein n=1 Tax=Thiomicrorhabdus chilensis TaxID=63656 RepID=UPI0003FDFCC5|nr:WbqC family protein [Thiomicrorhabdus chilensis]